MKYIRSKSSANPKENIDLHYIDYGQGDPIVFIHGWPLSSKTWEPQMQAFADKGFRCIAYDRRGFGKSSRPYNGYDYDVLAEDLRNIILELDLEKVTLVGFSMGGGEVVRYFTKYGSDRIKKAVLMSSIIPLVEKRPDNPEGVPQDDITAIMNALRSKRVSFMKDFCEGFFNASEHKDVVTEAVLEYTWEMAVHASPRATLETAKAWARTDFRSEMKNVTVPTLVIHGDADNNVPIETSGNKAAKGIPHAEYEVIKNGPHGLNLTHRDKVNNILEDFLNK